MEQRRRPETRHRRTQMLHLVRGRRAVDSVDHRHLPIGTHAATDDAAHGAPIGPILRTGLQHVMRGAAPACVEMESVARRPAGQRGGQRRGPALEIGARAEHAVGVDARPGIAEGHMLALHRRDDHLIVDAGIGHHHVERPERVDGPAFQIDPIILLFQSLIGIEIGAAGIGHGRHHGSALLLGVARDLFQEFDAGGTQGFRIRHQMNLADLHQILGVEELAYLDLMFQRQAARFAQVTSADAFFVIGQFHRVLPTVCVPFRLYRSGRPSARRRLRRNGPSPIVRLYPTATPRVR